MTEPTTDRPTDTIRDAFEAILHLLACLLGTVRTSHEPTAAEMIGAMGACEVFLDGYYEDTHAGLDALRDLIQRAAEEHSRRATTGGDWTPERIREARERCERATPGPWEASYAYNNGGMPTGDFKIPGHNGGATVEMLVDDAYFCAHARKDLPAALDEIERLTAERAELRTIRDSAVRGLKDRIAALEAELAACAPADASLEARALRDLFTKLVHVDHMARHLCENSAIDHTVDPANPTAAVDPDDLAALEEALSAVDPDEGHDEQTRARMMAVFDAADASRPWLTEEQAREMAREAILGANGGCAIVDRVAAGYLRASRGETGPAADQVAPLPDSWRCEECKETFARCACKHGDPEHSRNLGPGIGGAPIRVRPTAALDPLALDPEDGTLCADCKTPRNTIHGALCSLRWGKDPGRVPDPRATLHAGDPASVPDPRVDYSDSMRPAVLGGECAECLHAPPLHERTCSKVARRPQ
ncbi:MAG: hypothetical protein BWZ09_02355 [Alphaproteobacteria bacterium ADurb.BinA305]|nr:MAG: hypothetical protein BWZ09_02355 [Alphaproteobacteria bacterium ADurb.BinA305]